MLENDSIGEIHVPDDVYYGSYSLRSIALNATPYKIVNIIPNYTKNLFFVKKCTALANAELGFLPQEHAHAIVQACEEAMTGKFNEHFIVDMYQGNGDVATVMNANEILAKRANEILTGKIDIAPLKPNDHISCNQATTDSLMTTAHITIYNYVSELQELLKKSAHIFEKLAQAHKKSVRVGRTELRDALPVTFGQNFQSYHDVLSRLTKQGDTIKEHLLILPMGATAIGSGIGSYPEFAPIAIKILSQEAKLPFKLPTNSIDTIQNCDPMLDVAHYQEKVAATMTKIAKDIRLLCSGPNAGFAELKYPPIIPGSVTLPGKTNPTIEELVIRINMKVIANTSIATQCIEQAELEYNYLETLMNVCIMESFVMMLGAYEIIIEHCFEKLETNKEKAELYANATGALSILLTPLYGYATATKIGIKCYRENMNIADAVVSENLMTKEDAQKFFNPLNFTDKDLFYRNLEEAKKKYKC